VIWEEVYWLNDYSGGKDTARIDLFPVGNIDPHHLIDLSRKIERYEKRKTQSLVPSRDEHEDLRTELGKRPNLMIWVEAKEYTDGSEFRVAFDA